MQLNALGVGRKAKAKADLPQTMVVRLIEIRSEAGKPGVFVGHNVDSNERVEVRMMSVDEGVLVNKRADESLDAAKARVDGMYVGSGEKHRPRPAEFANPSHKTHCAAGGLMIFTKTMKNEDGTFRAHWAETLERGPGTAVSKEMAHVAIGEIKDTLDPTKVTGSYVVVDVIKPQFAAILNADNTALVLDAAFANEDDIGQRRPFVLARLIAADTGKVVTDLPEMRVGAVSIEETVHDYDAGTSSKIFRPGDAAQTLAHISDPLNLNRDAMTLRAAIHGALGHEGYPDFGLADEGVKGDLKQITDAVRSGDYQMEIIPGERIAAGPATKASLLKAWKGNDKHPLNFFKGTQFLELGDGSRKERKVNLYADTYVTVQKGEGNYKYFTKAAMAEAFPKKISLYNVATVNDTETAAEASKGRASEAASGLVDATAEEFDPNALTQGIDTDSIDLKLEESSAALEL